jgi:hypothetical protein
MAFQANTNHLWTAGSYGPGDWGWGMQPGTSPVITTLSDGVSYMMAFQANTGHLLTAGSYGTGDWGYQLDSTSSPAMTSQPNGGYQTAINTALFNRLWAPGPWGP